MQQASQTHLRFGAFEIDLERGELRKYGTRIRMERKPWQLLLILLEQPGRAVPRQELEKRLWPEGVFVDFERGLNSAIRKVRLVLGDDAQSAQYIETVTGIGYRFVGEISGAPEQRQLEGLASDTTRIPLSLANNAVLPAVIQKPRLVTPAMMACTLAVLVITAAGLLVVRSRTGKRVVVNSGGVYATSSSPQAMKLFLAADDVIKEEEDLEGNHWSRAGALLEQALNFDPEFATAHLYYGYTLLGRGRKEDCKREFETAFRLRSKLPDAERLFIEGSYYRNRQQMNLAEAAFESLVRLEPNHYFGIVNLRDMYDNSVETEEQRANALNLTERAADVRPDSFSEAFRAWFTLYSAGQRGRSRRFFDRAVALRANAPVADAEAVAILQEFPAWEAYERGDLKTAARVAEELVKEVHPLGDASRNDALKSSAAWIYAALGERAKAEALMATIKRDEARRILEICLAARWQGIRKSRPLIYRYLSDYKAPIGSALVAGAYLARNDAERDFVRKVAGDRANRKLFQAAMLLSEGRPDEAEPLLKSQISYMKTHVEQYFWFASLLYAETELRLGNVAEAKNALQYCQTVRFDYTFSLVWSTTCGDAAKHLRVPLL